MGDVFSPVGFIAFDDELLDGADREPAGLSVWAEAGDE